MKRRKGLTLVELLTVIAIIAALVGVTYSVYGNIRWRAGVTHCMSNLSQCGLALRMYANDWGGFAPPFTSVLVSERNSQFFLPNANDPILLANAFLSYSKSKEIWKCPYERKMGAIDPDAMFPRNRFTNYYIRPRFGTCSIPVDNPPLWVPLEINGNPDYPRKSRCAVCRWVDKVYIRWIYADDIFHEYGWDGIGYGGPKFRLTLFLTGQVRPVDSRKFHLTHPGCPTKELPNELPNVPIISE